MINTNFDFQKPLQSAQTLMSLQTAAITKTVELQKLAGEQLATFFKVEAEKAQSLKTPQEVVQFNVEANTALFELLKVQGEAFTTLAKESGEQAIAEIQKMAV
ncbi:MAG: hypothetical protein V7731_13340 [Amphritea sp.]